MKQKKENQSAPSRSRKWLIGSLAALGVALVVLFSILIYVTPDEQYREPAGVNAANTDARLNSEDPEANYFGKYAPPEEPVAAAPAASDTVKQAAAAMSENSTAEPAAAEPAKPKTEAPSQPAQETPAQKTETQPRKQQPSGESLFD